MSAERMRYLGVLGLLAECAVHVPEDLRESIERAMEDAETAGLVKWRRILNRIEVEPLPPKRRRPSGFGPNRRKR